MSESGFKAVICQIIADRSAKLYLSVFTSETSSKQWSARLLQKASDSKLKLQLWSYLLKLFEKNGHSIHQVQINTESYFSWVNMTFRRTDVLCSMTALLLVQIPPSVIRGLLSSARLSSRVKKSLCPFHYPWRFSLGLDLFGAIKIMSTNCQKQQ